MLASRVNCAARISIWEMTSLKVYQILDVWAPSIGVGFLFTSVFSLMVFKIGWKLHRRKQRLVNRWFFEVLRLVLRDLQRDTQGTTTIYGREIGRVSFALLAILTVPAILSVSFITFWNTYAVEEQIGTNCDSNYDCFPTQNGEVVQNTPVHNCSHWPRGTEYKCYQLVFNYVRGVSATGGILFFTSVILKIYTVTLLAPKHIQNTFCKWLCYCSIIIGGSLVTVLFILLHTTITHPKDAVFQTATYRIQFVVYSFTLFVVFSISGPLLIYGIEYEPYRQKNKGGENSADYFLYSGTVQHRERESV